MQFLGAAVSVGFVVITASLAWPRVSTSPRPDALQKVRDVVMETDSGKRFADVLGVADESSVSTVSVPGFIAGVAGNVASAVTAHVTDSLRAKVLESIVKQFNELPADQKEMVRTQICAPPSAPQE